MALDQNLTPTATEPSRASSAIDNEIPAYRAIVPHAVLSLICGILAVFSFASWFFLIFAAAAVLLGLYADAKIRRDPEIWTGRGISQAGKALGLILGLSAVTVTLVQDDMRTRAARQFSSQYASLLKTHPIEDAVWYTVPPVGRNGKEPKALYKELRKGPSEAQMMDSHLAGLMDLKKRLDSSPEENVHLDAIEASGPDGLQSFATARFEVHGPGTKDYPQKEQYALVLLKGISRRRRYDWWIEDIKYPYDPASYVHQPKPVDDGHGHAH